MVVASGISSVINAGLVVGGLANVAGNVTVGQNVSIGGTLTVNGKSIVPVSPLVTPQSYNWYNVASAGQTDFNISANTVANTPVFVSRNGLIEVPAAHYTLTGNVLSFSDPCIGGEMIYVFWSGQ